MPEKTEAPLRHMPSPFPWIAASLLYLGVLLVNGYYLAMGLCQGMVWQSGLLTAVLLSLLALTQWQNRRYGASLPRRAAIGSLLAQVVLFEVVVALDCTGFSKFLYLIVPFAAYFSFGKRWAYAAAVAYVSLFIARIWSFSPEWYLNRTYISDLLIFSLGMFFSIAMAGVVAQAEAGRRRTEKLLSDLEESHRALQQYAGQAAELAATEERNRLARDIHDSLGHYLTAINVQLEKAAAFRQRDEAEADKALQNARRSVRAALQDVRQSVGALRQSEPPFSLTAALPELVDGLSNGRLTIALNMEGLEDDYSHVALLTLYRVAQEGLTNIQKHAQAQQATVNLSLVADKAQLTISDDGRGLDETVTGQNGRFGLQGIRERLELIGGQMELQSEPGQGTILIVTVPKQLLETGQEK